MSGVWVIKLFSLLSLFDELSHVFTSLSVLPQKRNSRRGFLKTRTKVPGTIMTTEEYRDDMEAINDKMRITINGMTHR